MTTEHDGNDDKQRVRDASDIVRVVGEHVELKARGREYLGICPFHDDKKPSMYVVPAKQIFHCFSCGAGGDVFTFVQDFHRMTFREALKFLADRAGVKLESRGRRRTAADDADSVSRSVLLQANELAEKFFKSILRHPEHGTKARQLIERRGITQDMIDAFNIGAAPDRWDGLGLFLDEKQQDREPFLNLGLLKTSEKRDEPYDAQRNRLVFPIRDQIGRVVAFGGRRINDQDEPKYINSSESVVFDKSATLYGLDLANRSIQREGVAIIAEGYTDVIACHQAGLTNVVATLGTALTQKHATILRRLCHTVVLLFDGDTAGQKAADRAAEVFLTLPIDAKIATLSGHTDAKDPDELLKRDGGADTLRAAIADATELLEYRLGRLRLQLASAGAAETEHAMREEFRTLGTLGLINADKVRWQLVLRRLSELSGLRVDTIAEHVREGAKRSPSAFQQEKQEPTTKPLRPHGSTTAEILGCLLALPERWIGLAECDKLLASVCKGTRLDPLYNAMSQKALSTGQTELKSVIDAMRQHEQDPRIAIELERDISRRHSEDANQISETLMACLKSLTDHSASLEAKPTGSTADKLAQIKAKKEAHGPNTRLLPRIRPGSGSTEGQQAE